MNGPLRSAVAAGALLWLLAAACSLAVDAEELREGCVVGSKPCEAAPGKLSCVSAADPEYGCARESCVPCTLAHAVEVCGGDGSCAIGTCERDYENCDLIAKNGCEVDKDTSYDDCGACKASCDSALRNMARTETAQCTGGRCVVKDCQEGYADCDGAASNGCEKSLPAEACGRCSGCPGTTLCNQETQRCE